MPPDLGINSPQKYPGRALSKIPKAPGRPKVRECQEDPGWPSVGSPKGWLFLEAPWRPPGGPLEDPWRPPGGPLEGPWRAPGGPLEASWRAPGSLLEGPCSAPVVPLGRPWRAPGGPLEGPWRLPGGPLEEPWRAPGVLPGGPLGLVLSAVSLGWGSLFFSSGGRFSGVSLGWAGFSPGLPLRRAGFRLGLGRARLFSRCRPGVHSARSGQSCSNLEPRLATPACLGSSHLPSP